MVGTPSKSATIGPRLPRSPYSPKEYRIYVRVGCGFSSFQLTNIHVFASGFYFMLYPSCDDGDVFRYCVEDVVSIGESSGARCS